MVLSAWTAHSQPSQTNLILSFKGIPDEFINDFFPSPRLS
jgi:hypothetical protein